MRGEREEMGRGEIFSACSALCVVIDALRWSAVCSGGGGICITAITATVIEQRVLPVSVSAGHGIGWELL